MMVAGFMLDCPLSLLEIQCLEATKCSVWNALQDTWDAVVPRIGCGQHLIPWIR